MSQTPLTAADKEALRANLDFMRRRRVRLLAIKVWTLSEMEEIKKLEEGIANAETVLGEA